MSHAAPSPVSPAHAGPRSAQASDNSRAARRAFTLLELMVVIAIIVVLMTLVLSIGAAVTGSSRKANTENAIRVLDSLLTGYEADAGGPPSPFVADPRDSSRLFPVADARNMNLQDDLPTGQYTRAGNQMINSAGLFILQVSETQGAQGALEGLDSAVLRTWTPHRADNLNNPAAIPEMPTLFDGWGNPLRYVHPAFGGLHPEDRNQAGQSVQVTSILGNAPAGREFAITQIRRNNRNTAQNPESAEDFADSDGGRPRTGRPYFYSAGPSGDPSNTDDNVYSSRPYFSED